jgi:hypothetical protein
MIIFTYSQINYKYIPNFKYIQVHSNTFKYIKYYEIYNEYTISTSEIH